MLLNLKIDLRPKPISQMMIFLALLPSLKGYSTSSTNLLNCPDDVLYQILSYLNTETTVTKLAPACTRLRNVSREYVKFSQHGVKIKSGKYLYWKEAVALNLASMITRFNRPESILHDSAEGIWFNQLVTSSDSNISQQYKTDQNVLVTHILRQFLNKVEPLLITQGQWIYHSISFLSIMYAFHGHLLEEMKKTGIILADSNNIENINERINHSKINNFLGILFVAHESLSTIPGYRQVSKNSWQAFRSRPVDHDSEAVTNQYRRLQNSLPSHIAIKRFAEFTTLPRHLRYFYIKDNEETSTVESLWKKSMSLQSESNADDVMGSKLSWLTPLEIHLCRNFPNEDQIRSPWISELCRIIRRAQSIKPRHRVEANHLE